MSEVDPGLPMVQAPEQHVGSIPLHGGGIGIQRGGKRFAGAAFGLGLAGIALGLAAGLAGGKLRLAGLQAGLAGGFRGRNIALDQHRLWRASGKHQGQ